MKYVANFLRVFVGLLFIFSGLIKSNDPIGFSYKLDEYFSVFSADLEAKQDTLEISSVTENETTVRKQVLNPNSPTINLTAQTATWAAKDIGSISEDSVFFADAQILLNGKTLFTRPINGMSKDTILLESHITASINGHKLAEKDFIFYNRQKNEDAISIHTENYVKPNSWIVDLLQGLRPYALALAIFLCVLEIVLGVSLLIGWQPQFTIILLIILIAFFTFLTWYSAYYNKVTDCGCFGDAIKLTPWESFYKDIILSVSILLIFIGRKYITPIFSNPFAVKILTTVTLLATGFSLYCWHYLPVKNFLKFKEGNNIKELAVVPEGAPSDVYENIFIYEKGGIKEEFTLEELGQHNLQEEGYTFVDRQDKLISKGFEPEIHDFKIMNEARDYDYIDDFFADSSFKLLIVINEVENANILSINRLKEIITYCRIKNIDIYPLTASNSESVANFKTENKLTIPFYYGDKTNLKSIIRSNPGLVLFDGNVVKKTWPCTSMPSEKKLKKALEK